MEKNWRRLSFLGRFPSRLKSRILPDECHTENNGNKVVRNRRKEIRDRLQHSFGKELIARISFRVR